MIITHEYPVCEYDTAKDPIIHPTDFLDKCLPKKCIITFFRKELEKFAGEHKLPVIGQLHSEVLDIPIYKYENGENPLCITMPFSTAPDWQKGTPHSMQRAPWRRRSSRPSRG